MKGLKLEEHSPDGSRKSVGVVLSSETVIGRDPGHGLKLERGSISRSHGVFFLMGQNWCYKDLGSTNGSWHNSKVIKKGQVCVVRPGDRLQLADTFIVVSYTDQAGVRTWDDQSPGNGSVLVFDAGNGVGEYRILHGGQILSVGGRTDTVSLPDYSGDAPRLVIESRDGDVFLSVWELKHGEPLTYLVSLNGKQVAGTIKLDDRDEIVCGAFSLIVNKPSPNVSSGGYPSPDSVVPSKETSSIQPREQAHSNPTLAHKPTTELPKGAAFRDDLSFDDRGQVRKRTHSSLSTFGQIPELGVDDQAPQKMEKMLGSPGRPGGRLPPSTRRFTSTAMAKSEMGPGLKDRLFAVLGFLVVFALISYGFWLIFFSQDTVVPPKAPEAQEVIPEGIVPE